VSEWNTVIAMVQLVEPVGAETHVHLEAGGTRFIARVRPDNPLEMNQPMELIFDLEKINLFSKDGKEAVVPGSVDDGKRSGRKKDQICQGRLWGYLPSRIRGFPTPAANPPGLPDHWRARKAGPFFLPSRSA
jgi:hypothetical protein